MLRLRDSLRFSLGELLFAALLAGVGLAALRTGGLFAAAYLFGAMLLFAGFIVAAIVGRGIGQAFAIGFLVGASVYAGVLYWHGDAEFEPGRGELLTTRAAAEVYGVVREVYYVDVYDGREADAVEAGAAAQSPLAEMSYWVPGVVNVPFGSTLVARVGNVYWSPQERPVRREFMQVAHLLVALAVGYAAGKLGAGLYRRRQPLPTETVAEAEALSSREQAGETGSRR